MSANHFLPDTVFTRSLSRIGDIVTLSFLFIISCIPIFTIGSALSSASYVAINAINGDGNSTDDKSTANQSTVKTYISCFKKNFKKATISWLIMLFIGFVLSFDTYFWVMAWKKSNIGFAKPLVIISVVFIFIYAVILVHLFALIGNFENDIKTYFKYAFLLGIKKFPFTLLLIALYFLTIFVCWGNIPVIFIFVVCGFGLMAYLLSLIHIKTFKANSFAQL